MHFRQSKNLSKNLKKVIAITLYNFENTSQILQFLDDRNGNMDNRASQTAGMFLRSSYSGGGINSKSKINLMRHGGDVEREEKEREREMRLEELGGGGVDDQYRGPQLQVSEYPRGRGKGKGRGRGRVRNGECEIESEKL